VKPKPKPKVQYYGCFRDWTKRDLVRFAYQSRYNTKQACIRRCYRLGYRFAGVQYSSQCFCGQRFGRYKRARNCNMRCTGNRNSYCGGVWANMVFSTGRRLVAKKEVPAIQADVNKTINSQVEASTDIKQVAKNEENKVVTPKVTAQVYNRRETSKVEA